MKGAGEPSGRGRKLRLGPFTVRPLENRLTDGGRTVQLEPKMMDVLVLLAERAGEVVSKAQIEERVWADVFVTESVVTRAIAGLRRALGDDATAPRFIETISRRGYRLMVPVAPVEPPAPRPAGTPPPAAARRGRGPAFVGRSKLLAEILDGPRHTLWVLGAPAAGKTSLLRQVEVLGGEGARADLPLYWDLQGAATVADLGDGLTEALLDAADRLEAAGVPLDAVTRPEGAPGDAAARIGALRRAVAKAGRRLLLLCDEAEVLLAIGAAEPAFLGRLRRVLTAHDDLRSVLAATARLWQLAEPLGDTSPFLHGFAPPLPLGMLEDEEAAALLSGAAGGPLPGPAASALCRACGNHPALLQLAAAWLAEGVAPEGALGRLAAERSVSLVFEAGWAVASPAEREVLLALAAGRPVPDGAAARSALHAFETLGIARGDDGLPRLGTLHADWLRARG